MTTSLQEVLDAGPVIPVVTLTNAAHAVPLARALLKGGVRVIEMTLRTAAGVDAIRAIAQALPEVLIGAGTVLDDAMMREVSAAGARFAVSPGFSEALSQSASRHKVPLLPGVATPSELMAARSSGHRLLKLFPAKQVGGIPLLQAFAGPFPDIQFCPTGGISADNARDYLALPNVRCVGGSWLTSAPLIEGERWEEIEALARQASALRHHE